jgi:integrase/recombinase XerD
LSRGRRGIAGDHKGPLFGYTIGKTELLTKEPMSRIAVYSKVMRRAADAGIETSGCHTFRTSGITDYLKNGGRIEGA